MPELSTHQNLLAHRKYYKGDDFHTTHIPMQRERDWLWERKSRVTFRKLWKYVTRIDKHPIPFSQMDGMTFSGCDEIWNWEKFAQFCCFNTFHIRRAMRQLIRLTPNEFNCHKSIDNSFIDCISWRYFNIFSILMQIKWLTMTHHQFFSVLNVTWQWLWSYSVNRFICGLPWRLWLVKIYIEMWESHERIRFSSFLNFSFETRTL